MTPTASRLQVRLEERRLWFINEWFFKWHHIGGERPVDIDAFDGRQIHYGGIRFDGSARLVYWQAIVRGVRKEIDQELAWVDSEVRNYNRETVLLAIDQCAGLLIAFVISIRRLAVEKDRVLRGNGIDFPPEDDAGNWEGLSRAEIMARSEALKKALPGSSLEQAPARLTRLQRATKAWNEHQGWLGPLLAVVGLVGTILTFM